MLCFLKENSYNIFKMAINQIGMAIFGISLFSAATLVTDPVWSNIAFIATSVFSVLFYLVLLYTMTWDIGSSERVRIDGGRLKYNRFKGLYMSLFANVLNFIFAILGIVGYYCAETFNAYGSPATPKWANELYGISSIFVKFAEAMYDGIIVVLSPNNPLIFLVIIIPSIVTCSVAYIMGVKGKHYTKLVGEVKNLD